MTETLDMNSTRRRPPQTAHVHVCSLRLVPDVIRRTGAKHMISAINLETMLATPEGFLADNHLRLGINDICEPMHGCVHPTEAHVEELIRFARAWDHAGPLVVHCYAGISRSTASALITLCTLNPEASEAAIARKLRTASAIAQPNRLMVTLADDLLGRRGRMVDAINTIGQGQVAMEGVPFHLESRFG